MANEAVSKKDIAAALAETTGKPKGECEDMVDYFVDTIVATLVDGTDVALHGLGKFTLVDKPARNARNPKTGKTVKVPAKKGLKFKPSITIKKALNE